MPDTRVPASFLSPDGRRLNFVAYAFLALICVAFFTPGIASMPPTDRDESSFAQASKQMIESGNYTDIRLQAEPRYKKPIGIYWLQSAAVRIFNPHHLNEIWAYRIPSFLGATIAVLMTAALGALLFSPATGMLAALMMAGCVLLNVEARLAKTDAALLACVVTVMYGAAYAFTGKTLRWRVPILFWTALAFGILIKGPIILLPLCGVLLWLKISNGHIAWFKNLHPVVGILYALALIVPWFIAISMQSHGTFMQQSAGNDMFAKLWQGQNRGILPPGLHLLAMPIVFFPFSLFVMLAAPDIWKNRHDAAFKFCLGWAVPTWIVFELSLTKLPHYVLPAYPAIALLTAKCVLDGLPTLFNTSHRWLVALAVALWLVIGTGLAICFVVVPVISDGVWNVPQIAAGGFLILLQSAALLLLRKRQAPSAVILTISSLIFLTTTLGYTIPRLQHVWMSRQIMEAAESFNRICQGQARIVSAGYHEPSLVFLAGTDTIMAANGTEAANALKQAVCRIAVVDDKDRQAFLDAFSGDEAQPVQYATVTGINTGHGVQTSVTLYYLEVSNKQGTHAQ